MQVRLWVATGNLPGGSVGVLEEGRSGELWVKLVHKRRDGETPFGVSFVKKRRRCSGEKLRAQMWESRSAAV